VPYDPDVVRRDRFAMYKHSYNMSPWQIGHLHYDQRDLYTRNARIDDGGYGRGPSTHPEEGSYAYVRSERYVIDRSNFRANERGPNGYERVAWPWLSYGHDEAMTTDGEIGERVRRALVRHPDLDASDIEVRVQSAKVTLEGTVPDRPSKRLAKDMAMRCRGVKTVKNRLRVAHDDTQFPFSVLLWFEGSQST
jgi:hypothetical protein